MKTITQQWLDFAQTDLQCCKNNLHDAFVTNVVAFHSQQFVEKAFKALLEEKEIAVPRIHNLTRLHTLVESFLVEEIEISELEALDSVYTSSRYPSNIGMMSAGKPTLNESLELYQSAKKIYEILVQTINS